MEDVSQNPAKMTMMGLCLPKGSRRPKSTRAPSSRDSPPAVYRSDPAPVQSSASPSTVPPSGPRAGSSQRVASGPGATGPRVAVIGTSLVCGIGSRLNRRGVDAMTYTFPGYEVPLITERMSDILTRNYQPETVVLQCGGNDIANNRPTAQVIKQIDYLVREVKRCCPSANIVVNKIPPCGHDETLMEKI